MIETLGHYKDKGVELWRKQTRLTKSIAIGLIIALFLAIVLIVIESQPHFVPLYSNLSANETGQIKQTLDSEGVKSKVSANGTTISVPANQVNNLKVQLAAQGIPKSGHIDYSFFGQNAQWGMTDKEFNVLNKAAMQTELARLISNISGVKNANVMISLPQQSMWVSQKKQKASASVVLELQPGYQLQQNQVDALYHLVSKSVPNLPISNIVIMDQMFNYYEPTDNNPASSSLASYEEQSKIKKDIEQNIQQQVQRMLGMMIGRNKVVVSVTANIDFTQQKATEKIVQPINKKTLQGLPVSVEKIRETYSGNGKKAGGTAGTGTGNIPGYVTGSGNSNGKYSHTEQRINYVFNQVHKTIVQSPYTVRDLGIQVMIEPPIPNKPSSLPKNTVKDIKNILGTMVRTTLPKSVGQSLTKQQIAQKIYVSVQPFNGRVKMQPNTNPAVPTWYYIVGGLLVLLIVLLIILLLRKRKNRPEQISQEIDRPQVPIPDLVTETEDEDSVRRKQLEKMAQEKPEEFAKLLRSWLSEE